MTRYPSYRRLGKPQGRSGWVLKISPPPGFDPRTIQVAASRYTDWAILAHKVGVPIGKTVGVANDGGPAMRGTKKGLMRLLKNHSSYQDFPPMDCIIHREHQASKYIKYKHVTQIALKTVTMFVQVQKPIDNSWTVYRRLTMTNFLKVYCGFALSGGCRKAMLQANVFIILFILCNVIWTHILMYSGFDGWTQMTMHSMNSIKFINARQAKQIHQYKNLKESSYTKLMQQYCTTKCAGNYN